MRVFVMPPLLLQQVIRPSTWMGSLADRSTNPLLLTPVFGAFFQVLVTHRVPSLGWAVLLLLAALATRVIKAKGLVRERAAILGGDGLSLEGRFVAVPELARVERLDAIIWVTSRSGERFELHVDEDEMALERAELILHALERAIASSDERDAAGQDLVTGLKTGELQTAGSAAYRGISLDAGRWLAIAEDAAASPEARIAAARLVIDHTDDAVRIRIGAVAHATANPALRDALLESADGAEPELRARRAAEP